MKNSNNFVHIYSWTSFSAKGRYNLQCLLRAGRFMKAKTESLQREVLAFCLHTLQHPPSYCFTIRILFAVCLGAQTFVQFGVLLHQKAPTQKEQCCFFFLEILELND